MLGIESLVFILPQQVPWRSGIDRAKGGIGIFERNPVDGRIDRLDTVIKLYEGLKIRIKLPPMYKFGLDCKQLNFCCTFESKVNTATALNSIALTRGSVRGDWKVVSIVFRNRLFTICTVKEQSVDVKQKWRTSSHTLEAVGGISH